MQFSEFAVLASGAAWTVTYIALVYRGFKDRSYGMPLVPLALNLAWEATFSLVYPPASATAQAINIVWLLCDLGIVATYVLYGYPYFRGGYGVSKATWYAFSGLAFVAAFGVMLVGGPFFAQFTPYFHGDIFESAKFIAFIQNAVISVSFVSMFYMRGTSAGQSFTIAWTKWLGTSMTVGVSYLFVLHPEDWHFIGVFVGVTLVFDVWYMALIYGRLRREGLNPWTRL